MTFNTVAQAAERWCRTPGTRDLGEVQGSGLLDPCYLVRRGDGQVVQVSRLLYLVTKEVSAHRDAQQVAAAVSAACGRELSVEGLNRLLASKLEPIGLVENLDREPTGGRQPPPHSDPLLALRLRCTLLPAAAVRTCARYMAPIFRSQVAVAAVAALVAVDVLLVRRGDLGGAFVQVLATPALLLLTLGLLTLGALVHELGHAAACAYGGAQPGVIGFGVYLVFPAFFTNVSDSERLVRAGRIRTDLGGLYLNVWCLLALGGAYLGTGQGVFLLAALLMHVEMLQQLIPAVRFDGYFVLSDLAGVPDLFARMRPALRSLLPGRPMDPRLTELRPAARRIVVGWVLLVTPVLAATFGWLLYTLPLIIRRTLDAIGNQVSSISAAWTDHLATVALGVVSIVFLAIPLVGIAALFGQLGLRAVRPFALTMITRGPWLRRRPMRHHGGEVHAARPQEPTPVETAMTEPSVPDDLTASALTDETILGRSEGPRSSSEWRRAVYWASGKLVNPGPTAEERRRAALLGRVTAPIQGSRRVVVMSRKGGVGKTTVTMGLGSTYSTLRGDRVVAVDANPDAGNLAHRVSRPCPRTITDLLDQMDLVSSYADLRDYTAQAPESRLEVLASNDDPRIGLGLDRKAYQRVIELLDHYYNLILLDTGTGILDSANQGLLAEADQLVVVLRPALDGARAAALTLDWLTEHDYSELVARAVVVINGVRRQSGVPIERVEDHFARRCAQVVMIPWDRAFEGGARTSLSMLAPQTRQALTELAAAVADQFANQTYVRTSQRER
jgi:putative peptide zinc metalloprotease protein